MTEKYQKLHDLLNETFVIVDKGIIKLICAAVISNRMPVDPVWLFIVGPSGCGKTEFISGLDDVIGIYPISSLTSKTFISGIQRKDRETSLLLKVQYGTFTFKDWTSMISMHQEERKEIMAQLREIYDGKLVKRFGNGKDVEWKGKIGMISGVTSAIHVTHHLYSAMGERFLMYSLELPDRLAVSRKVMENVDIIRERRIQIRKAFKEYLDEEIGSPIDVPKVPKSIRDEIEQLADFSTLARSPVERDWYSRGKDITFVYSSESPSRFSGQLYALASSLMTLNKGELMDLDREILYKIALDSITATRRKALQELSSYTMVHTAGLATKINYPTDTVRRWLEDLNALGMVKRIKEGSKDAWQLDTRWRELMQKYEHITPEDKELDTKTAEESVGGQIIEET